MDLSGRVGDRARGRWGRPRPFDEAGAELRFFGGLTQEESAQVLGVSLATANREWATAKAWLYRRLKSADGAPRAGDR